MAIKRANKPWYCFLRSKSEVRQNIKRVTNGRLFFSNYQIDKPPQLGGLFFY